jgi:hypothetical protein
MVTMPKLKGGMEVIRLRLQNEALLLKNLHKFFSKQDLPWVNLNWDRYYKNGRLPDHRMKGSFWWKQILKLLTQYRGLAEASAKCGETILFWSDLWNSRIMSLTYPHLHSFAKK